MDDAQILATLYNCPPMTSGAVPVAEGLMWVKQEAAVRRRAQGGHEVDPIDLNGWVQAQEGLAVRPWRQMTFYALPLRKP